VRQAFADQGWGFLSVPNGAYAAETKRTREDQRAGRGVMASTGSRPGTRAAITLTNERFDFEPADTGRDLEVTTSAITDAPPLGTEGGLARSPEWASGFGQSCTNTFSYGAILGANRMVHCSARSRTPTRWTSPNACKPGRRVRHLPRFDQLQLTACDDQPACSPGLLAEDEDKHHAAGRNRSARRRTKTRKKIAREVRAVFRRPHFAPRIKCPVRFAIGYVDLLCPPHCVYAAYNALKPTVDRRIVLGPASARCPRPIRTWISASRQLAEGCPLARGEDLYNPDHRSSWPQPYPDRTAPSPLSLVAVRR
jgi:hypothetical protein